MITPSKYQTAVYEAAKNSTQNLGIKAVAGSGKSYTLEQTVNLFDSNMSILVTAFNKDIAASLKVRIKHPKATVKTINAFGAGICRQNLRQNDVDKDKTENVLRDFYDMEAKSQRAEYYKFKFSISRLVELFRANLIYPDFVESDIIEATGEEYGVELPADGITYFDLVKRVYNACVAYTMYPDFRDQVFLPIYLDLPIPKFDIVLIDESQDLDRNQMELVLRAGRRIIMVGDPNQAIYGFRGAMTNAMDEMVEKINATTLPLSVCYRCPKAVVALAKEIVSEIESCDHAPEGLVATIKLDEFRKKAVTGDFVLCRCTAPLVSECLGMIREGKKATVKGREIGIQLLTLVEKIWKNDKQSIESFANDLKHYENEQISRLTKLGKEQDLLALNDKVSTILVLLESCKETIGEISQVIASIFSDQVSGIIFMTAHKSKGLEHTRVFILDPTLMPHTSAKKPWQLKQEMNLKYVAITRCKFDMNSDGELYWVNINAD